jgi:hypothetical protein
MLDAMQAVFWTTAVTRNGHPIFTILSARIIQHEDVWYQ